MDPTAGDFDALILAGGEARRLGGADKAALIVDGTRLIDRVIAAVREAATIVAVGPSRPTASPVVWTREVPEGGGPVAAVAAGLELVEAPRTVVLAVDLPRVDRELISDLVRVSDDRRAAVAIDGQGRLQPLLACYPTAALRTSIPGRPGGMSMMALLGLLDHVTVDDRGRSQDCDTWADASEMGIVDERGERDGTMA